MLCFENPNLPFVLTDFGCSCMTLGGGEVASAGPREAPVECSL